MKTSLKTIVNARGITLTSTEVRTPDGRTWAIDFTSTGGLRLFEIDPDGRRGPEEHNAIDADAWSAGDLVDYLKAVGERK